MSASEHAWILREAGLLRTERRGSAVQHRLTDLAVRLLDGRDQVVTRDVLPADFGVGRRASR